MAIAATASGGDTMAPSATAAGHVIPGNSARAAAATATDVASILTKKRQHVTSYVVEVSGQRRDDYPRKFTSMKVHHIFTGRSISPRAVAHAIELSETKYCSVAATLRPTVEIQSSFEIIEESPDLTRE